MFCPKCKVDLDDELIFDVFMDKYNNKELALEYASFYGANETSGKFGRQIAIYDRERDRTVAFRCPDCNYEWKRE